MGRRYFCEYCNRAFADTLPTRKRHLKSIQHQRLRKLHYDSFKDAATLLAEEALKKPCKNFFQYGNCKFGDGCQFSHVNPEFLKAHTPSQNQREVRNFDVEIWLSEWRKKHPERETKASNTFVKYWLPRGFPPQSQLPPSLCPPPPGANERRRAAEWGV
ncbi:zinc finger matrin-type protein 5-like [Rhopilema esculentum]|uniref:zinc finger matrin-type protein 5-like n=1 Tax=Rhopilema esculentum TaxID=499914 RepID=UPI0031D2D384|eukprot:gene3212-1528_t